ncbi:hypothetical protein IGI04_030714 [Brassica rapa subsp. trilocularis]|uniref:Uncharacterized protein n=1 Tax=Brassica rapa subsp. trilocularis TaxID=1813537 RepID=A0ABQ7LU78_BRACM|nr:hypothetical protein IGI04_030714 [Brassica rapa subsp. trilocularis]
MEKNYDLAKELEMEKEKENKLKEFVIENKLDKKWWNIPVEGLSIVELKQRHQAFVNLSSNLFGKDSHWLGKDGGGSSSDPSRRGYCDDGKTEPCE